MNIANKSIEIYYANRINRLANHKKEVFIMRVLTFVFALMLVMGLSFGGASFVGTQASFADDKVEGEMPGGEMEDGAEAPAEGAEAPAAEDTAEGEIPGGEMTDDAAK